MIFVIMMCFSTLAYTCTLLYMVKKNQNIVGHTMTEILSRIKQQEVQGYITYMRIIF